MNQSLIDVAIPGVQGLHPYVPGKPVEELQRELGLTQVVKLASNENPLGMSPLGMAAAKEVLEGLNYYPDDLGFRLKARLAEQHGVDPGQITLGAGSSDVLEMVAHSFLQPGRNAVYAAHSFAMYAIYTQASGAEAHVAPAMAADDPQMPYGHDLDAMADQIDAHTRVVFIANPNNPTGTWLEKEALKRFIDAVPPEVVIVLDEAYTEYVTDSDFPNGLAWVDDHPNLLVTRTFSKIYGLAGLRIGYGVSSAELAGVINRVRAPFNANSVALAAAEAALDDVHFIEKSQAVNAAGLQQLCAGFEALGLATLPSAGNFVCVDFGRPGTPLFEALLRAGVIVRPVANYGLPNHLRITVGTAEENQFCLRAVEQVLAQ